MFDPIIKQWATEFPSVTLHHNTELVGFEDKGTHVAATVRDTRTGETREITADYMVGTDGGASFVRETLGIGMSGHPALTYTTNVIFRCPDLAVAARQGARLPLHLHRAGRHLAHDRGDQRRRPLPHVDRRLAGEGERIREDDIRAALTRAMGKDFDYEILSVLRWVRRELVAESYGRGRVYMAGDAVHLTSPTGALGMNTGMQDAVDLGWKLDAVLKGWGGANLLATYEIERKPVAMRNIKASTDNLERMLAPRTTHKPTPEMFQPGPAGDAARKQYGAWYTELMRHEWFMNGYHLGYRYDDSPIVVAGRHAGAAARRPDLHPDRAARRARAACVDRRGALDARSLRQGFRAAAARRRCAGGRRHRPRLRRSRRAAARRSASPSPEVRKLYERALVLVRPDGHVAWRADEEPADAAALVDCVRGAGRLSQMQAVERAS